MVSAHQWVRLGPGSSADTLVDRAGSWGLWLRGLGVPEFVFTHWWVRLGPMAGCGVLGVLG